MVAHEVRFPIKAGCEVFPDNFVDRMFIVLHSSAGAGKTHALVKRFLMLALKKGEADAYAGILALTFTNKAASEMRDRVLRYLEALAAPDPVAGPTLKDVLQAVMGEAGIAEAGVQRRARAMLTHMVHHWSQLAVTTIDAFTRRVVMPFTRELQLDQELRMTTEEAYYRAKAIDLLLEETGRGSALTEVLVATCEQLLEEERSWRVDQPLMDLSTELTKEKALEHLARLKDTGITRFIEIRRQLRRDTEAFRDEMRNLGKEVMEAVKAAGLTPDDFPYKGSGYIGFFRKLEDFESWIDPSGRFEKARETDNWAAKKAPSKVVEAIAGLVPLMCKVYGEVEARRDGMRRHALHTLLMRDLLPTAALNSIAERLRELKREEGVSFFSDLTREVLEIVQKEPAPFLYERLGERYTHFLVDEFQDTSLMQWHALLPLVENALAGDGTVFLVGDAKQAIYRWRNGEVRQFTSFPRVFGKESLARGDAFERVLVQSHVPVAPLAANYRSAAGIVGFNNALTGALKQHLAPEEIQAYADHAQQADSTMEGYVEVGCYDANERTGPEAEKRERKMQPWRMMVRSVKDSLDDGFTMGDIVVLVRSGGQGALASRHLAREGWDVVAPDGLTLEGSPVAAGVVNVLAWLVHRSDEAAARAAQSIAIMDAMEAVEAVDPFAHGRTPGELLGTWQEHHPYIHPRQPLVALVAKVSQALGHDPAGDGYAMGLLNEAHAFSMANGDDLPGFLEHWDRTAKKRPAGGAPGGDAIRVMTIHKAKGLEFPVVIIPEAGAVVRGNSGERIWVAPSPPIEGLPATLVKQKGLLWEAGKLELPEAVEEERLSRLDDLNVLYVAITRAEQRLYLSVPKGGRKAGVLAKAICGHLQLNEGGIWRSAQERPRKQAGKKQEEATPALPLTPGGEAGERKLAIRLEAPVDWDPASPDLMRSRGKAIHAILARVRTPADLGEAVRREGAAWGLVPEEMERLGQELAAVLAKPQLAPFYGDGMEVHTEATVLDAQGRAWRPDRVVRDGSLYRVLDIKTGKPVNDHQDQVRNYVRLLREVEDAPVEGFLLYVRDGEVVPVDA